MSYRVGVDIGGTFTDLVYVNPKGEINITKSSSIPGNAAQAVFNALKKASEAEKISVDDLLSQCEFFVHGATIATNAVLERKVAKTGLIVTKGFRDILILGPGRKPDTYNLRMEYPAPYIPRYRTLEVCERVDYAGNIIEPLNEDDVRKAIAQFKAWNVQAVAVALLWSITNPAHEQRIAQIIEEEWPGIPYSVSSEVQPIIREYLRYSATSLDASLKPVVGEYLSKLVGRLKDGGLKSEVLVAVSVGGVMSARELMKKPVHSLLSGPSTGPLAGLVVAEQLNENNTMTIDMGGTSFEVSVAVDGRPAITRGAKVGNLATGINTVEVSTIGAGGGSIAWVDAAGMLHMGPQSAGADPGPACYGNTGGTEATVTDANVVLGYLDPDYFLGGQMKIDPKLSEKAILEKVAKPLNISLIEAASAMYKVVNQNMVGSIEYITIKRGLDPRDYIMIVGGGAGASHAARLAQELRMKRVLVPKTAGGLCALGMLASDITFEMVGSLFTNSVRFDFDGVNRILADLEKRGVAALDAERIKNENRMYEYFVDARYPGQTNETAIQLRCNFIDQKGLQELVADFHDTHQRMYGSSEPDNIVECSHWRVEARGLVPKLKFPHQVPAAKKPAKNALKGMRKVYFEEFNGMVDTAVYDGTELRNGNFLVGPAVIEEPTTTIVVPPEVKVTVTEQGDFFMEIP
ncbi:MAG: hydantoinase/oxoprolinase family protein [Smithella sp.]